jgi:acetylornithine deacetylase/succinyl-diaminopimelate desuccinylase-like protein
MKDILDWLSNNHIRLIDDLRQLVAIPSISTDLQHQAEIDQSAGLVKQQMQRAGLNNVELLSEDGSNPYVYGEWLGAPGKPTVFLYAHHDVQPVAGFEAQWESEPFTLTERGGRLYGRGSADDKAAVTCQLGSIEGWLRTRGKLPVNIKMLVEGEEEIGSKNLMGFLNKYRDKIRSDVIVVCDSGNLDTGVPCITYSLRGIVAALVEVEGIKEPKHSGGWGGLLPDAAIALNVILSRLFWNSKRIPIPGLYARVKPLTMKEKAEYKSLPLNLAKFRKDGSMPAGLPFTTPKGVGLYEQNWRQPAVTIIAQEASSLRNASNQVLPKASAIVSVRIVPNQKPDEVFRELKTFLTKDPPWGVKVKVTPGGRHVSWWMTDPQGPAFEAARAALKAGFKKQPLAIGCGGTIGFVGPLADLFGGAPALLLGIEDAKANAHGPNESMHEGDFRKLTASLAHLYDNLSRV